MMIAVSDVNFYFIYFSFGASMIIRSFHSLVRSFVPPMFNCLCTCFCLLLTLNGCALVDIALTLHGRRTEKQKFANVRYSFIIVAVRWSLVAVCHAHRKRAAQIKINN